jgi:aryl-alcohol dehydrogenase-like predicted oxidoreductase
MTMEKRPFGRTDMKVGVLGFGGAEIGYQGATEDTARRVLNEALDAGLNVIDTAECYMESEDLIGRTVANRRDDYYLFTKSGHPEGYDDSGWNKPSILKTLDRSLKRLRTDRVDLLQLHSCSLEHLKRGEVIEALEEAKKAGKTRYIGYSGDSDAAIHAIQTGRFDALQISVSMADQEAIDRVLPEAVKRQMGVIAKRPIGNAVWGLAQAPDNDYHKEYYERFRKLDYEELKTDRSAAVGLAMRFCLTAPGVHTAIVGTQKPGRYTENVKMLASGTTVDSKMFETIRARWRERAPKSWIGQI